MLEALKNVLSCDQSSYHLFVYHSFMVYMLFYHDGQGNTTLNVPYSFVVDYFRYWDLWTSWMQQEMLDLMLMCLT